RSREHHKTVRGAERDLRRRLGAGGRHDHSDGADHGNNGYCEIGRPSLAGSWGCDMHGWSFEEGHREPAAVRGEVETIVALPRVHRAPSRSRWAKVFGRPPNAAILRPFVAFNRPRFVTP